MLNLHFTISVENFRDGDKPIDRTAIRNAILKSLQEAGHSADARPARRMERAAVAAGGEERHVVT